MPVGYSVAVCRRLLQLVVLEAVEGGGVALRGGAEQLLRSSEGRVVLLLRAAGWPTGEHRERQRASASTHQRAATCRLTTHLCIGRLRRETRIYPFSLVSPGI